MNLLNSALAGVQNLVNNQETIIYTSSVVNIKGFAQKIFTQKAMCFAHIQPLSQQELNKYTEHTLDSRIAYKFYYTNNYAKVISSLHINQQESFIKWNNEFFNVFAVKDWYLLNGWVYVCGVLQKDKDSIIIDNLVNTVEQNNKV